MFGRTYGRPTYAGIDCSKGVGFVRTHGYRWQGQDAVRSPLALAKMCLLNIPGNQCQSGRVQVQRPLEQQPQFSEVATSQREVPKESAPILGRQVLPTRRGPQLLQNHASYSQRACPNWARPFPPKIQRGCLLSGLPRCRPPVYGAASGRVSCSILRMWTL